MKVSRNWKTVAGWVLHGLVAGIMLLAGSAKVLGLFPAEQSRSSASACRFK